MVSGEVGVINLFNENKLLPPPIPLLTPNKENEWEYWNMYVSYKHMILYAFVGHDYGHAMTMTILMLLQDPTM